MTENDFIVGYDDLILITGANGFIGSRVIKSLLGRGFMNLRCFVRPTGNLNSLNKVLSFYKAARIDIVKGNLLSRADCVKATKGATVILHLAMQREKTFPGCYMNTVVTTRNLLDAAVQEKSLKRFVNVSSFAVYSNWNLKRGAMLDETCPEERALMERHEVYAFVKAKQDELLREYAATYKIPYVIVRPGAVYGPGQSELSVRIGINTFGFFMHLGGSNRIPLTYVDNCADAIALAGIKKGVDGEIFNIVDDDLPTSRQFLRLYKKEVGPFRSVYIPYSIFYLFNYLWEKYSKWSEGQLPPLFNRRRCATFWKGNRYSNAKLKELLGWTPAVSYQEASKAYFDYMRQEGKRK